MKRVLPALMSLMAASCGGFNPVCDDPKGCVPPPAACAGLDEAACLARSDCSPSYAEVADRCAGAGDTRCGGFSQVFKSCEPKGCAPVTCELYCEGGFARDESGCEVCACQPPAGCTSDAQCAPGERCGMFLGACKPGGECPPQTGRCVPVDPGCASDADCGPSERCAHYPVDCVQGYECEPLPGRCEPVIQSCEQLDEKACLARADCEAMYEGPRCGNDPEPAHFVGCKPAACLPVMCLLYCEKGFQTDERGCPTCACDDSCQSDADCGAGQVCSLPEIVCPPGMACTQVARGACVDAPKSCTDDGQCAAGERCSFNPMLNCGGATNCMGTCEPNRCKQDADCRAGESCIFLMYEVACPPNDPACPYYGTCNALPKGCSADSDCAANEQCGMVDCGPNMDCALQGQCVPRPTCASDADCDWTTSCQPDPTDRCNGPEFNCETPGRTICLPVPTCTTNSDCSPGRTCKPDLRDPCNQPQNCCFAPGRSTCQ